MASSSACCWCENLLAVPRLRCSSSCSLFRLSISCLCHHYTINMPPVKHWKLNTAKKYNNKKSHTRGSAHSLLFADLLPGLKVVHMPISFHDPQLSPQSGNFGFCLNSEKGICTCFTHVNKLEENDSNYSYLALHYLYPQYPFHWYLSGHLALLFDSWWCSAEYYECRGKKIYIRPPISSGTQIPWFWVLKIKTWKFLQLESKYGDLEGPSWTLLTMLNSEVSL